MGGSVPGTTRRSALAAETGVSTYKTHVAGAHLLVGRDKTHRYTGLIPKISPLAIAHDRPGAVEDRPAGRSRCRSRRRGRPSGRPSGTTSRSASTSRRTGIRTRLARDLFEMAVRGLHTGDLYDVSLLNLLMLVRGHHSLETLFSIEGGAQENLVDGGAGSMAARMAADLGDAVHLGAPVRSISQQPDHVVVTADGVDRARRHGSSCPCRPRSALDIAFDPVMPADRVALYRGDGRRARVEDVARLRRALLARRRVQRPDVRAELGRRGHDRRLTRRRALRRAGLVHVQRASPRGSMPWRSASAAGSCSTRSPPGWARERRTRSTIVETAWWHQEWTRGCSMAHFRPGVLTSHGHLLREPWGRIHWAGTETATTSHGAIDGAIRSGERAAREILDLS